MIFEEWHSLIKLRAYVSLARPLNAFITFLGVCAAGYIAGAKAADYPIILFASCAAALLGAAGNCVNDVFDVEIDKVNKPKRAIAAGVVTESEAWIFAVVLASAGLVMSGFCGSMPFIIACFTTILMYAYSVSLKRIPLVGNLAVATLTALVFIYGAAVLSHPAYGFIPAVFALLTNFAREILKDVEDMEGDAAQGVVTYPLFAGVRPALGLVTAMFLSTMILALLPFYYRIYSDVYLWIILSGVEPVFIFFIVSIWRWPSKENIGRIALLLKYDMLIGMAALVLGSR